VTTGGFGSGSVFGYGVGGASSANSAGMILLEW
jgi:hypothetical protein